jgi:glycosyltransferase involved in cell wall biosynthesis/O-antigen/teichoic acid export membrane protein
VFVGAITAVNLSNFVFHVVLSRLLGPASYGALGALLNVTAVLTVPIAALQVTVTQSVAERPEGTTPPLGRLLRVSLIVGVAGVLLWTAATPTIDRFFHLTSPRPTVILGPWLLLSVVGAVLQGVLIGQRRFHVVAISQLAGAVLGRLAFGVILVKLGLGVTGGVAATVIGSTVSCLVLLYPLRTQLRWHGTFVPRGKDAALSVVSLSGATLLLGLDTWLGRHFLAALAAGYFAAATTAGRIALFLPAAITVVYFPQLAAIGGVGPAARRVLARCVVLVALVSFGAAGAIVLLPSTTVDLLFGAAYARSASAVGIVALADAAIAVATCLVYYQVARRSRLALSAWPTCVFAAVLAALFHGSIVVLALDMLAASVAFLIGLGVPTVVSVLRSFAEETSSLPRVAAMLEEADLDLTVVVPFHNVGPERLRAHLSSVCEVLAVTGASFEVVPVSDGSTDGSEQALGDLPSSLIRPIVFADNRGKGEALRIGLAHGRGRYLGFIDGDGDIPAGVLTGFVELARNQQPDMVVGSKRHPGSRIAYPAARRLYSFAYQLLTRTLFGLRVRDTQTGVKLVRRDVLAEVLPRMVEKRFAFDLELLAVAHRLGYRQTAELPVEIGERFTSTISLRIVWRMLQDTLATFYRLQVLRFYDPPLVLPGGPRDGLARLQAGEPLRILVCNWRDLAHPQAGGAEVYTHAVASEWVRSGHHVTWYTSAVAGRPSLEVVDGVHIVRRGGRYTVYRQARRFFERQGRGQFDLVVDEVNTRPFGAAGWAAGTPVVAVVHQVAREVWFHEMSWPVALLGRFWFEPRWLRRLRDIPVLTVSESSRASLQSYGLTNIWVVPEGQGPVERPAVERECVPTMIFVGRLASNKRPVDVIAAFQSVRRRLADAQLWMIGTGPLEEELRRRAPEGVTFLGRLSENDKIERLARAHALVATSVREGWGLNVSEAAQVGTPTVAYDVAGLRDSVSASGGLLVAPEPGALADVLVEHLPRWTGGDLPPVRCDGVAPWPEVADTLLITAKEGLVATAQQAARDARADVAVAWRRVLGPIGVACDRRAWSVAGIAALIAVAPLSQIGATVWEGRTAGIAFICFAIATVGALADAAHVGPLRPKDVLVGIHSTSAITTWNNRRRCSQLPVVGVGGTSAIATPHQAVSAFADVPSWLGRGRASPRWMLRMAIVVVVTAVAAQSWFAGGGAIGGGDLIPPVGTAWLAHVFSPWTWNGSNLGGPGIGAMALPWAVIDATVHALGGSGALAQRVFLTGLFVGVGAGAVGLLTALEFGTLPAVGGGLVYAFSSYVVATAGASGVYLAGMALVPALAGWVVVTARARQLRWCLVAMLPAAAILGLVAENPPMVLPCVAALLVGPLLVAWLYGRGLLFTALRRTALGIGVLVAASAYWMVPYVIQLVTTGAAQVGAGLTWTWTEGRATLANGFWLNNSWAWAYPAYFPYAHWYQQFPLVFVKYLLPVAAFASLGLGGLRVAGRDTRRLRLIAASSAVALALVLLSTGTRFPGAFIFNLLYSLPYGWLLQDPGRFLFGTSLAYAVLIAVGLEGATSNFGATAEGEIRGAVDAGARARRRFPLAPIVGIAVLVLPGLPLMTGALIPGARSGFPSDHVAVPGYWETMATFVDHDAPPGNLLVLPEDDFYQMPYTWYYGADGFITDMISRNVVDPTGQGYSPASSQLLRAVGLLQQSLLAHDWRQVMAVAQVLDTRDFLVRGDIEYRFQSRDIANPATLASALVADPDVRLVAQTGPLDLFAFLRPLGQLAHLVTVNSRTPDLGLLSLLPSGSGLVTSAPRPGILAMTQLDNWSLQRGTLTTSVTLPAHRRYDIASLSGSGARQLVPLSSAVTLGEVQFRKRTSAGSTRLLVSAPLGQNLLADGTFAGGTWEPVGNCDNAEGLGPKAPIGAFVNANGGPRGSPYLALSAETDSACESAPLSWRSGPVLVYMAVRHVEGAPPRLCLYEVSSFGQSQCASTSVLPSTSGWTTYSTVVKPAVGTRSLSLFLYGDGPSGAPRTVDDYADVQVHDLPTTDSELAVLAEPATSQDPPFITDSVSYSSQWEGPSDSTHVLVDGLVNGWIGSKPLGASDPHYALAGIVTGVELATGIGVGGFVSLVVGDAARRRYRRTVSRKRRSWW